MNLGKAAIEQLRERVAEVCDHRLDLRAFHEWLIDFSSMFESSEGRDLVDSIHAIEHALAEYTSGHLDPAELRSRFAEVLPGSRTLTFGSSSSTVQPCAKLMISHLPAPEVSYCHQ
jgi:hypothetical protein